MLCALALTGLCMLPAAAMADGPITPAATDYLARVTHVPAGMQARTVDGYVQLWVRADPGKRVVIKDFRGAEFLKFTSSGVYINHNSQEYYLNQVPIPAVPPRGLTAKTPPRWFKVSSGRQYTWREGRLHALATIALQPGQSYVGRWQIPVSVNGVNADIRGGMWHHPAPSPFWFWPVLVMLLCALAAWRVRSPELDRRLAKGLTLTLMALFVIAMASRQLHGRPYVDLGQVIALLLIAAVVAVAAARELARPVPGLMIMLATAIVAMWAGVTLIPVLTHGYVLVAFPPFIVRCVVAALLGGSLSLFLVGVRFLGKVPLDSGDEDATGSSAVTA